MAERTRDPNRPESTEEGTFDEKAVARILQRATELERLKTNESTKLTLAEIEAIARDAGIDPALVSRAVNDLRREPTTTLATTLLGEPTRRVLERVIPVKVEAADHERLVAFLRGELAQLSATPPAISSVGRSLTYFNGADGRSQSVEVQLMPEGEGTMIRIIESSSRLAGGIVGGAMGLAGGGVTPIGFLVGSALADTAGFPVAVGVATVVAAYLGTIFSGARALYGSLVRKQRTQVDALMTRLEGALKAKP